MTKLSRYESAAACEYCRRPLPQQKATGRPRKFCSTSHRQRAFESRRRAASAGLPDGCVVVRASEIRDLHDRIFVLEAATDDVEGDARFARTVSEYRAALEHLLEASRCLRGFTLEPVAD